MMKKLMQEMAAKEGKMNPEDKAAKIEVLKILKKIATEMMADGMKESSDMPGNEGMGMKKVSVMAKDQEGLEEGLDKAKELIEGQEGSEHEMAEESEEGESEDMMAESEAPESSDESKLRAILAKKQA
jgi:hypothetical protein